MTYIKLIFTLLAFFLFLRVLKLIYLSFSIHPALKGLLILCLLLGAVKILVLALERVIPFVPSRKITLTPEDFLLKWKNVQFTPFEKDSPVLHGWFIQTKAHPKATILYFHGNAGNITGRIPIAHSLVEKGYHVFLFDYRGYGKSEGSPSEKGLYEDAKGAYDYLVDVEKIAPGEIIFMGRSLGCSVAVDLSLYKTPKSLVLISPLTSAKAVARSIFLYYPFSFFMSQCFDNEKKIIQISAPVLIAHSPEDGILPFHMGKTLFQKAREPKTFITLKGGHNDDYFEDKGFMEQLDDFMSSQM